MGQMENQWFLGVPKWDKWKINGFEVSQILSTLGYFSEAARGSFVRETAF